MTLSTPPESRKLFPNAQILDYSVPARTFSALHLDMSLTVSTLARSPSKRTSSQIRHSSVLGSARSEEGTLDPVSQS